MVNRLIRGVLVMANANVELQIRWIGALKPELHTSNRNLCAPSIPLKLSYLGTQ